MRLTLSRPLIEHLRRTWDIGESMADRYQWRSLCAIYDKCEKAITEDLTTIDFSEAQANALEICWLDEYPDEEHGIPKELVEELREAMTKAGHQW